MMTLTREFRLLRIVENIFADFIQRPIDLIEDQSLRVLSYQYTLNLKKRNFDIGFNLFGIISEKYHQENFHSDILRAFIDPEGGHRGRDRYLRLFLEFLCSLGAKIDISIYTNVHVVREKGRIDLLIKDEDSKRAIIIENKINGAEDMPQQIPRYLEYVKTSGYTCDAIVYLRLNSHERPDTTGWTAEERKEVNSLLKVVSAYNETKDDLFNGWILKSQYAPGDPDAQHILRQYAGIIKKLGGNIMNKPLMEQFYTKMLVGENHRAAMALKSMLDDFILYRVERIIDTFKNDLSPFTKIANCDDENAYFSGLEVGPAHYGIDVVAETEGYIFQFWDRNDENGTNGLAKKMLKSMNCLNEYTCEGGLFKKQFAFPSQEAQLFEHVKEFKQKLVDVACIR